MKTVFRILTLAGVFLLLSACSLEIPTISAEEETRNHSAKTKTVAPADTLPAEETSAVVRPAPTQAAARVTTPAATARRETTPAGTPAPTPAAATSAETPSASETEPPTEPTTEAPTEPPIEPTTEVPTEPPTEPAPTLNVGDMITFGHYEQDGIASNGQEEIQWIVLQVQKNEVLLLSRYCLDCRKYHEKDMNVTWEGSDLRAWLNGSFLLNAFDEAERTRILPVVLPNKANPVSGYGEAANTEDKVFLLSIEEVELYLSGEMYKLRGTTPTRYAMDNGSELADNGNTWWWLRTNGRDLKSFAEVYSYREFDYMGDLATNPEQAVRPAILIDVKGLTFD